jgi:hypothetical protein
VKPCLASSRRGNIDATPIAAAGLAQPIGEAKELKKGRNEKVSTLFAAPMRQVGSHVVSDLPGCFTVVRPARLNFSVTPAPE